MWQKIVGKKFWTPRWYWVIEKTKKKVVGAA
jgi:hypothetical protein